MAETEEGTPPPDRIHRAKRPDSSEVNEEGLGIYEDNADGTDLTDTENDDLIEQVRETNKTMEDPGKVHIEVDIVMATRPEPGGHEEEEEALATDEGHVTDNDSEEPEDELSDLRLKTNTPADHLNEWRTDSRTVASGLAIEVKEDAYKEALELMTTRCYSQQKRSAQTPLVCVKNPPFGRFKPKFFYVKQSKPVPMPPLKAWRGYHGNVYFEPISVQAAKYSNDLSAKSVPSIDKTSGKLREILETPNGNTASNAHRHNVSRNSTVLPEARNSAGRPEARNSAGRPDTRLSAYDRQLSLVLDKHAVLDNYNSTLHEDLIWIHGRESKGSLREGKGPRKKHPKVVYNKERICKGSMAHKLFVEKRGNPFMAVSGNEVYTHYTQSNYSFPSQFKQGRSMPTPVDPPHYGHDRLPPVEQLHLGFNAGNASDSGQHYARASLDDDLARLSRQPSCVNSK